MDFLLAPSFFLSALAPAAAAPQQLRAEIPLTGLGDPNSNGKAFGLAFEPASGLIFVAVCGDLPFQGTPNRAVAVVDPATERVIAQIPVGAFPEEIAFAHDPASGALRYGACTNSQDGSVTIWDASLQIVATVPLPDPLGYGTCFPFGIVATSDHFLVTTQDGSGDVHAIALATLALDPAASRNAGAGRLGARCALVGAELWLADSLGLPGFSGAEGGLRILDLAGGAARGWLVARDDSFTRYPAGQDLAPLPTGGAWLGGTDLEGRLWRADASGELLRAMDLAGRSVYGLACDAAGERLAATTLYGGELLLADARSERVVATLTLSVVGSGHALPNDALFVGDRLYVTCQGSESLLVFDGLPALEPPPAWSDALVVAPRTPLIGQTSTATLTEPSGGPCWLLGSDRCDPTPGLVADLRLGPAPRLHAAGFGALSRAVTAPSSAGLRGRTWFLQGVTRGAGAQPVASAPAAVALQ